MSSSFGIKVIAGLIHIHIHLYKLSSRAQLRAHTLLDNYILRLLLKARPPFDIDPHHLSFPAFDFFNKEFSSSSRIVDSLANHFSFHFFKKSSNESFKSRSLLLNDLMISSSLDSSIALMITNTSIKNNITTSIAHIHICNKDVIKIIHHTVNVLSSEAELFAIRCGINQTTNIPDISKIVVITDLLHAI